MNSTVLVVDDEPDTLDSLSEFLVSKGYVAEKAGCLKAAQDALSAQQFDAVLLDMHLPDGNGVDWIRDLREQQPHLAIIVITGAGDIPTAVEAMRNGADHFLTKPVNLEALIVFLARCLEVELLRRRESLRRRLGSDPHVYRSESRQIRETWRLAETAAESEAVVLLLGETGTGKGVFARWIHDNSARHGEPYVELNCSSIRGDLLASELFGHRKGAFTSAIEDREGLIEAANGGTLFLDEIGDMDLAVQTQILKVIEEKEFRRVGESKLRRSEFRLICATNKDLAEESEAGRFRKDLYFRICIFLIEMPPLRQYPDDLPGLIDYLLGVMGYRGIRITTEAMRVLQAYAWPGNVRELRNVLERACLLAKGTRLDVCHLPGFGESSAVALRKDALPADWSLGTQETMHVKKTLTYFNGDVNKAAHALGISRATFYRKLKDQPELPRN